MATHLLTGHRICQELSTQICLFVKYICEAHVKTNKMKEKLSRDVKLLDASWSAIFMEQAKKAKAANAANVAKDGTSSTD